MRLRYLVMLVFAVAAAAFYVGVNLGVREFKEVDELGSGMRSLWLGCTSLLNTAPAPTRGLTRR